MNEKDRETGRGREEEKVEDGRRKTEDDAIRTSVGSPEGHNPNSQYRASTGSSEGQTPEHRTPNHPISDLKAYRDGQLGWWAAWTIRRHVAACAQCREEMQAMRDFSALLQNADAEPLSPQLRARILAAVPDTPPILPVGQVGRRNTARPLLAWGAVASAVLVCFALYPAYQAYLSPASDTAQVAKSAPTVASASRSADEDTGGALAKSTVTSPVGTLMADTKAAEASAYAPSKPASVPPPAALGGVPPGMMGGSAKSPGMGMPPDMRPSETRLSNPPASKPAVMAGKSAPATAKTVVAAKMTASPAASDKQMQNGNGERQARNDTPETADLLLLVTDVAQSRAIIEQTIRATGGHVTLNTPVIAQDTELWTTIALQIPTSHFDTFLAKMRRMGEVKSENIAGENYKKADSAGNFLNQNQAMHDYSEVSGRTADTPGTPPIAKRRAANNAALPPSNVNTPAPPARPANLPQPGAQANVIIRLRAKQ